METHMDEIALTIDVFWFVIVVAILGLLIVSTIVFFAKNAFLDDTRGFVNYEKYLEFLTEHKIRTNLPVYVNEAYADYLQKRNEFWSTYGQVVVALFIVIILAILMLTQTITAEAGLPILSAVSGFAIAKGVNSAKNTPNNPIDQNFG